MPTLSDLIVNAQTSRDPKAIFSALDAIFTCTDPDELLAALDVADPEFKRAINARLDQLALEELLDNVLQNGRRNRRGP